MKIRCANCGYVEKTDKDFFVKLIGGAMPGFGLWSWTTYLFAGTGFAMAIVVAIIGGGVAMLIYKDEIVEWIINKDYKCPKCGKVEWRAYDSDEEESKTSKAKEVDDNAALLELQTRIERAERILHSMDCEFEEKESGWLILEPSGDLKEINSIHELEIYVARNFSRLKKTI